MEVTNFLASFNDTIKSIKGASTQGKSIKGASTQGKSIVATFCMYNKERVSVAQTANGKWQKTPAVVDDCLVIQEPYGAENRTFEGENAVKYVNGKTHTISIPQIVRIEFAFRIENETILNTLNVPSAE